MTLRVLTIASLFSLLPITDVQASEDPGYLIQSCKELVGIYAKRDQKRLAAGLTTSVSEALRAGYCMGVLEQYRRQNRCDTVDWFRQAHGIAELPLSFAKHTSVRELLGMSCEI